MDKGGFQFDVQTEISEIVVTEMFAAPRAKVWKALTEARYIPEWWGPRNLTTKIDKQELKVGGAWRFVQTDPAGEEFAFHGNYQTVDPPQELAFTFEWEAMPGHVLTETTVLEEVGGQTKAVTSIVFPSREDMEGMLKTGMESGNREGHERLVELLAKLK